MRNLINNALILSVKPLGENNRLVTWLNDKTGIEKSVLYGGPKSKLKSSVSPFNAGILYTYEDQVKQSSKITDFDVKKYHLSFRESLYKSWAANLCAEILLKTNAAGSFEECFKLTCGFLDGMDLLDDEQGKKGLVRYLWRYLELMGVACDTSCCVQCDSSFFTLNNERNVVLYNKGGAVWSHSHNGFICSDCVNLQGFSNSLSMKYLTSKSIFYIYAASHCDPVAARNLSLEPEEFAQLKAFVFTIIQNACGSALKSLESGVGIL